MTQETKQPGFIDGIPPELGFSPAEAPYKPEFTVDPNRVAIALEKRRVGMETLARVSAYEVEATHRDNATKRLN